VKVYRLKKESLPKIAVLASGLAAAVLAVTMSPQVAHAFPSKAQDCANCHTGSTSTATRATPSTTTPAAGATYTVAITLAANPTGGNSGYAIIPVTAGTGTTNAGNTGALLSYTATMTAPAAAGTYSYTVYTNQGSQATGQTGSATYAITVTGGSTTPPTTSPTATTTATTTTSPTTTTSTAPATTPAVTTPPVTSGGVHGPYTLDSAQCGTCHRSHAAKAPTLLKSGSPLSLGSQSTLCLSCHDGTGASPAVKNQYALTRPVNNATTREYYSHDAIDATPVKAHTESQLDEFGGVSNRHSECADCHNSHQATATAARDSTQYADGWDASRRLAGVSGVSVLNGAAGTAPTYKFLSGADTNVVPGNAVTREYQLCFKCHSGFTTLTSNAGLAPSQYALDKGVEFNPANPSFHPVEAAGKNVTAAMTESLAGTSPYKMWNFTIGSTIRCLNCHASGTTPDTTPAPLPLPGSVQAPHTSSNRGILLKNYKDRVLKTTSEAYSAGDFALCYVCHAEAPFAPGGSSSTATNFSYHSKHTSGMTGKGTGGTDIDTAGDGQSNAICAECHFRLHSTTNKVGTQAVPGSRLVNFAPNVQPVVAGGTISWTPGATSGGSCTLTCHGKTHNGLTYGP
jgi:predicted CXXCH cytochrome family protein